MSTAQLPRPPHELISGVPPVLSAIVMKCLAKVAEERYQSAEGLRHDLAECVEGLRRGTLELFVLGKRDLPSRFQLPQRLYGRDAHVATLLRGFERIARGGRPELLLVRGYSGIGKPLMTDADMKPVMSVLARLFPSAYFTDNNLLVLHVCRMVSLSLRCGNSNESVTGYSSLGVQLGKFFKRYHEGYAYGVLARALVDRHNLSNERGRALFTLEMISYWCRPLAEAHEHALSSFQHAVQTNNYLFACYIVGHLVWNRLAMGHCLDDVHQDAVARMDFMRKTGVVRSGHQHLVPRRFHGHGPPLPHRHATLLRQGARHGGLRWHHRLRQHEAVHSLSASLCRHLPKDTLPLLPRCRSGEGVGTRPHQSHADWRVGQKLSRA